MTSIILDKPEFFTITEPLILYHGSLLGLQGDISVKCQKAGERREFGLGFCTAATKEPAQRIVSPYNYDDLPKDYIDLFIYTIKANLSGLRGANLSGFAWIMYTAYNWGYIKRDFCPDFCDSLEEFTKNISIVTGPISDDKLFPALQDFLDEILSFEALNICLRISDGGMQYVFKDQDEVDNKLKILNTARPNISQCRAWKEREDIREKEWRPRYNRFRKKARKNGRLFSELMEEINSRHILFAKPQPDVSLLKLIP